MRVRLPSLPRLVTQQRQSTVYSGIGSDNGRDAEADAPDAPHLVAREIDVEQRLGQSDFAPALFLELDQLERGVGVERAFRCRRGAVFKGGFASTIHVISRCSSTSPARRGGGMRTMRSSRETPVPEFARLFAGGRWIRTIGTAAQ